VFQAFLTTFLIDSGYKTPVQNMDELFASGIKLAYPPEYSFIFEFGDEMEVSNIQRNLANCPAFFNCVLWAKHHKNVSLLIPDISFEYNFAIGNMVDENSKPLLCRLEDGVFSSYSIKMLMIHADPLMRRVNEIIDCVVEAGLYNHWIYLHFNWQKILNKKVGVVHPLDGYYSFNLYHTETAFYLLLMGWCLSALCFMVEVLYNRVLSKTI
jgi:hypothetical protein